MLTQKGQFQGKGQRNRPIGTIWYPYGKVSWIPTSQNTTKPIRHILRTNMASGPITSWEIDGETVSDFILGGSEITADGD